ncbi:hypothetical protein HN51_014919 [Arachis hypogaea]|uniref:Leucine-rich repeat extensin-like protein 3 n=1 Tax=Arachis duranensis TaxID=130453 RepID=A0A6P5MC68_ARADU|nr:leucine-rich repeat extensin-like protein 3 [Arachis duranensis]
MYIYYFVQTLAIKFNFATTMDRKVMTNNNLVALVSYVIIVLELCSSATSTTTVAKDLVPCTMCVECDNPCQPLSPPPPPAVVECPPPPSLPPPPPPSLPPPAVVECPPPPPPQPTCPDNCGQTQGQPHPPPYPVGSYYFPGGTPSSSGGYAPPNYYNNGERMVPFSAMLFPSHFLCLVYVPFLYYLFT